MIEISHLVRKAYVDLLDEKVEYLGINIPLNEEVLTDDPAKIARGSVDMQAYLIISNINVTEGIASKCDIAQNVTVQIDVITVFPGSRGGGVHRDLITNDLYSKLFTDKKSNLDIPGLWRTTLESSGDRLQDTKENRIFRKILIFSHSINQ